AAIGCAQMERIDELIAGKRRVFKYYEEHLRDLPVRMNPEPEGTVSGYWMPTIVVDEKLSFDQDKLLSEFKKRNIDGRVFFWPLSLLPPFNDPSQKNNVSTAISERGVNLPSYSDMAEDVQKTVVETVRNFLSDY
ncbi:MAG: DegT/DnrJ/EryC1/StrS aminotransferase family protein, partial [Methanobacteriota archaeon]